MARVVLQALLCFGALVAGCGARTSPGPAAARPFSVTPIANFSTPWAMAFLPGSGRPLLDMTLVTEKEGKLWLVGVRDGSRREVSGVPAVEVVGQGGLGDVAVRLESLGKWRVYLSFVEAGPGGTSGAALGYGTLDVTDRNHPALKGFRTIWRQQPKVSGGNHYSHRIAFGPDGLLYLSSGERFQFDPAQRLDVNIGKVLRLTPEGAPAPGNPWASRGGVTAQIWTLGHRNPLGLAFDAAGRLWETEMGPRGGDELNLIVAGRNYGWPKASNGTNYDGSDVPDHRPGDGFEPPKVWWNPSISPAGLLIYQGNRFPRWKGDALIPALSGEALIRVDLDGDKAAKADQWDMGARIRAVDEGPDGSVYLLEDGGRLLRLDPAG